MSGSLRGRQRHPLGASRAVKFESTVPEIRHKGEHIRTGVATYSACKWLKTVEEDWSDCMELDPRILVGLRSLGVIRTVHFAKRWVVTFFNANRLVYAARGDALVRLWIGDSHSLFFNQKVTVAVLSRAENMHFVWALGPRLMWSISKRGFPVSLRLAARIFNAFGTKTGNLVPIIVVGEIDVRCHLASPSSSVNGDMSFVPCYVESGRILAASMGSRVVVFVVPVPPGRDLDVHTQFPIVGSLDSRLEAFAALRAALALTIQEGVGSPRAYLLDATDILIDSGGQLDSSLTTDGCHVNREGALLVHERLRQLVLRMSSGNVRELE